MAALPEFFDTHAHLDFPEFAPDLDALVERATAAGIARILSVGTTLASSRRVLALAERFPSVYAIVGVHPNHVLEEPEDIATPLRELARHPKVVALGETGLDFYRLGEGTPAELEHAKARQKAAFQQQLEVAAETGFQCVIHERQAFPETYAVLAPFQGRVRGVFHCYTGTVENAQAVLALGSLVSFTGITTFKNAENVRDVVRSVPLGKFMLETDCPFLAPVPYRGKRCEPAYVRELAAFVAQVKGCSVEDLSHATCATAREFFPRLG